MDVFNNLPEQLALHLWAVSWQVSILIGLIWILDRLSFRASSLFRYMLWFIVLLRLCVPVSMTIPVSIENYFELKTGIDIPFINTMIPLDPITQRFEFKTLPLSTSMEIFPEPAEIDASKALYDYAGILWFTAVFLICALILVRVLWIKRLLKRCAPVKRPDLCSMVARLGREMGIKRPVSLFYMSMKNVDTPSVIGVFRPGIFLPRKIADEWALEDIEPVLLHELAHVKRRDLTINWLQVIVQVVYFFHPLVWFANRRMRRLREELCDDIAVNKLGTGRKHYTRSILRVMEESFREPVLGFVGLGFSERKNTIGERIRRIMSDRYRINTKMTVFSIIALIIIGILGFLISCGTSNMKGAERQIENIIVKENDSKKLNNKDTNIVIKINENGDYEVEEFHVTSSNLAKVLKEEMNKKNTKNIIIHTTLMTLHKHLTFVLKKVKDLDIKHISVATDITDKSGEKFQGNILDNIEPVHVPNPDEQSSINVKVLENGEYEVEEFHVTSSNLAKVLKEEMEKKKSKSIIIKVNPDSPHKHVVYVMDIANSLNAENMSISYSDSSPKKQTIITIGSVGNIKESILGVLINGKLLIRGKDYNFDNETGELTLLNEEAFNLVVDYQEVDTETTKKQVKR